MVQKATQNNGRRKRKGGPATVEGRQNQIVSRLNHGIRSRSPVLLHVESSAEWQEHLEGFRQSYAPVGEVEECLVHLIAYQFWRWIADSVRTFTKIVRPKEDFGSDNVPAEVIQEVLTKSEEELRAPLNAGQAQLVRYKALQNGTSDLVFTKAEVQELFAWFVDRIEEGTDSETEDEDDQDEADPDEDDEVSDEAPEFNVEDRPWSVAEVQSQLETLCDAAGLNWREELEWFFYYREEKLDTRRSHLAKAKAHIERKRILSFDDVNRLSLYERQINAVLKSLINQLERHQARRQGQPVAAPMAVDVMVLSNERSVQSEVS